MVLRGSSPDPARTLTRFALAPTLSRFPMGVGTTFPPCHREGIGVRAGLAQAVHDVRASNYRCRPPGGACEIAHSLFMRLCDPRPDRPGPDLPGRGRTDRERGELAGQGDLGLRRGQVRRYRVAFDLTEP